MKHRDWRILNLSDLISAIVQAIPDGFKPAILYQKIHKFSSNLAIFDSPDFNHRTP